MIEADLFLRRIALLRLPGLGWELRKSIFEALGTPQEREEKLLLKAAQSQAFLDAALKQAESDALALERGRIRVLWLDEEGYPPVLKELRDPPLALFVRGRLPQGDLPPVAIVGTRHPSALGIAEARRLGRECAERGLPCVSGLALGIDAWAHRGYLEAGGEAVAVLGHGPDMVYPSSNRPLARGILDSGGALVSEYLPGIPPWKWHFPARNRIISGLSRAVVIVDAPERSGALITADYALDQGRDVWVAATLVTSTRSGETSSRSPARSTGTLRLANEGARLLSSMDDVLADWGVPGRQACSRDEKEARVAAETGVQAGRDLARALAESLPGGRLAGRPDPSKQREHAQCRLRGTDYQY